MKRSPIIIGSKKNCMLLALCPGLEPSKCYTIKFNFWVLNDLQWSRTYKSEQQPLLWIEMYVFPKCLNEILWNTLKDLHSSPKAAVIEVNRAYLDREKFTDTRPHPPLLKMKRSNSHHLLLCNLSIMSISRAIAPEFLVLSTTFLNLFSISECVFNQMWFLNR